MNITKLREGIRRKRKESKGFTLMELIIVVAIIAILLALLVPNMTKFLGSAKDTAKNANAKTAYTSAAAWAADMATQNVAVGAGNITITNGSVNPGSVVLQAKANELLDYLNKEDIKTATITIVMGAKYAVTKVTYADGGESSTYPKEVTTK